MNASAIAAFALLLSAPSPAADGEPTAASARGGAPWAPKAKAPIPSAGVLPAGGIACHEEYRFDGTVVLAGRLSGQRPSPAMAATGDLLLPQLANALVAVPPTFDAARCSLEINEREVAECLE